MITSGLPWATDVQDFNRLPTVAAGRPLMKTELEPVMMGTVCRKHRLAGALCEVLRSVTLAALRVLMMTSVLPVAMV